MEPKAESENRVLLEAAKRFGETEVYPFDGDSSPTAPRFAVLPDGRKIQSLKAFRDEWLPRPERRKGTATLATLDSFIAHVNRHKGPSSVVFADVANRAAPRMIAVFDYNEQGAEDVASPRARFGQHRAEYPFPLSDEWKAWSAKDGQWMTQADFAAFLEERIPDVQHPESAFDSIKEFAAMLGISVGSPQRLMEVSRGLSIAVGQKIKSAQNLSTGEVSVVFVEEHNDEAGGQVKVPGCFAIAIPVFKSGAAYQIPVRLSYRHAQGQITWRIALQRTDKVWDHATGEACAEVEKNAAIPLFHGTPEK